jgi:deoxycytidylate deaminase
MDKLLAATLSVAKASPCKKRKVGAIVVDTSGNTFIGANHNYGNECEDVNGATLPTVVHAEVEAIRQWQAYSAFPAKTIYVTHPPCDNCKAAIANIGIKETIIVEDFMKFDSDKASFELLPASIATVTDGLPSLANLVIALRNRANLGGLAYEQLTSLLAGGRSAAVAATAVNNVLKYGAKKYKPNNWRNVDDINRYWDALMRHCIAIEHGEEFDAESKLPHRDHALCNIVFLAELTD